MSSLPATATAATPAAHPGRRSVDTVVFDPGGVLADRDPRHPCGALFDA
jgi:hypothetical protein